MFGRCNLAVLALLLALSLPCQAQQLIESYQAFLKERDHFNSNGQRLTTAAAIIRQNRANFHRFGLRDQNDEDDHYFADSRNRGTLERLLERGQADPNTVQAIVNGTPLVRVEVYRGNRGDFVIVRLVSSAAPNTSPSTPPNAERQQQSSPPREVSGTGFFVSANGHVVTNFHVVKECTTFNVSSNTGTTTNTHLMASDSTNDLAVLSTQLTPTTVPAFDSRVRVGDNIFVYGFPLAGLLATAGNFTTGNITATAGLNDNTSMFQISAPVQPGSSGGPLVDQFGNVIGVIVSKLDALRVAKVTEDIPQNVNFAIKASVAISFLESHGLDPVIEASKRRLEPANIAELVKQFTVRVTCR
jgi:S1-C subfamily serine protease